MARHIDPNSIMPDPKSGPIMYNVVYARPPPPDPNPYFKPVAKLAGVDPYDVQQVVKESKSTSTSSSGTGGGMGDALAGMLGVGRVPLQMAAQLAPKSLRPFVQNASDYLFPDASAQQEVENEPVPSPIETGSCNPYFWKKIHDALFNLKWRLKFMVDQSAPQANHAEDMRIKMLKTLEDIEYCDGKECGLLNGADEAESPFGFYNFRTRKAAESAPGDGGKTLGVPKCADTFVLVNFRKMMKKVIFNLNKMVDEAVELSQMDMKSENVGQRVMIPDDALVVKNDLKILDNALRNLPFAACCPPIAPAYPSQSYINGWMRTDSKAQNSSDEEEKQKDGNTKRISSLEINFF